jgi:hypothetical protein
MEGMNTEQTQEVIFKTKYLRYQLHVKPEKKEVIGGEILLTPARLIAFDQRGEYRTSDPEEIALIRKAIQRKKDNDIFEVTDDDIINVEVAREALKIAEQRLAGRKTARGAINTAVLKGDGAVEEEEKSPAEAAKERATTRCEECGKEFENDPKELRLKAHVRMVHKRSAKSKDETEE